MTRRRPTSNAFAAQPYDGEIAYADACVGKLLDALRKHGLYDETMIAVMADHGESLGAHGENTHGVFLYDETLHVPLLIKLPLNRGRERRAKRGPAWWMSRPRCSPLPASPVRGDAGESLLEFCKHSGTDRKRSELRRRPSAALRRDRLSASGLWLERAAGTA